MTSGGNRLVMGASQRAGTQPVFKTWSSIDQELAASACPPQALKRPQSVARVRSQEERALFPARFALKSAQLREALLNVLLVGGAVGLIVTVAAAALIAPYILIFMET